MTARDNEQPLRVCFIAGTLDLGGAERQLYYMARSLTQCNVACCVLSLTQGEPYEALIQALGVPVIWVGQSESRFRRLWRIVAAVRAWQPDVIQCAHSFVNLYALIAAKLTGCLDIGAIRSDAVEEFRGAGFLGHFARTWPTVLIANSRQAIEAVKATGVSHKRLLLLENVIDSDYFKPPAAKRATASDAEIWVLCVGRGHPIKQQQKRQDIFLRTIAQVRQKASNAKARLVGPEMPAPNLEKLVVSLGLQDHVEFQGAQDNMVSVYQSVDVLALTSDYEGMPNVIMEAMACGLPVVATRVGAVPDLVVPGVTGFLAEVGDVEALAAHVIRLLADPALRLRMGQAARERILRSYSLDALGDRLLSLYNHLLKRRTAASV